MLAMNDASTATLDFYAFGSTNGHKVAIALDELGRTYERSRAIENGWFKRVGTRPAVARRVTIPRPLPQLPARKRVWPCSATTDPRLTFLIENAERVTP